MHELVEKTCCEVCPLTSQSDARSEVKNTSIRECVWYATLSIFGRQSTFKKRHTSKTQQSKENSEIINT